MSIFPNASNFVISGGNFVVVNEATDGQNGINLLYGESTPEALYDSSDRDPPPRCHPGTREQYVEDIVHFASPSNPEGDDSDISQPLYWMSGPAGVGKSAIAQTCVEKIKEIGHPCLSFFFSINGRSKHARFFPTIAYQLSTEYPEYRALLDAKIRRDRSLLYKAMAFQFAGLIVEPWLELQRNSGVMSQNSRSRIPIFVDGLDECDDRGAQCTIIELVAASARKSSLPFCWLFFSRPETHLNATFAQAQVEIYCHKTFLPISRDFNGEIELYLRAGFENILRRRNLLSDTPWPSEDDMGKLVDAADGLFIFGATALRFADDPRWPSPEEPLRIILDSGTLGARSDPGAPSPFCELDNLYLVIMMRIQTEMLHLIHLLLSIMCLAEAGIGHAGGAMGAVMLSNVLNVSSMKFRGICNQLSAVIRFQDNRETPSPPGGADTTVSYLSTNPGKRIDNLRNFVFRQLGGSISFYHKSFYDFLSDPRRSGIHAFETPTAYNKIFQHFLERHLVFDESYRFENTELALPQGTTTSAPFLSCPSKNEFANSLVQAGTYSFIHGRCLWLSGFPSADLELCRKFSQCDFRKSLYAQTTLFFKLRLWSNLLWGSHGRARLTPGTRLFRTTHTTFEESNIGVFKQRIQRLHNAGVIQKVEQLPPGLQSQCDSGFYVIGHGQKSTFWYWEINLEDKSYREFETVDIDVGMKRYQDEDFGVWPQ